MKKLMTAVLAVCPKVRSSASDLRQVDVLSRHCAQCPPQPDKRNRGRRNGAGAETPEGGDPRVRSPWLTRMHWPSGWQSGCSRKSQQRQTGWPVFVTTTDDERRHESPTADVEWRMQVTSSLISHRESTSDYGVPQCRISIPKHLSHNLCPPFRAGSTGPYNPRYSVEYPRRQIGDESRTGRRTSPAGPSRKDIKL
jgi:hypothetical protein